MALWQYTFYLLPEESTDIFLRNQSNSNEELFDDEKYWHFKKTNRNCFKKIDYILPLSQSWSEDIDLYGKEEANCFEVIFNNNNDVESVSFRIDFRSEYEFILQYIIDFCKENNFIIIDENLNIMLLNLDKMKNIIEKSSQVTKYKMFR